MAQPTLGGGAAAVLRRAAPEPRRCDPWHIDPARPRGTFPSHAPPGMVLCVLHHTEVFMAIDGRGRDRAHEGTDPREDPARRPVVAHAADDLRGVRAFIIYATGPGLHGARLLLLAVPLAVLLAVPDDDCVEGASDFGQPFQWWPLSPALIILIFPLGFRLTCYYYRKAYYRAFWLSPPACAVAEPHAKYTGETRFPLILQNVHRYFWYVAVLVGLILSYDVVLAFRNEDHEWGHMGLGTADDADQRRPDLALHAVVPLLPPHRRRPAAALLQAPGPLPGVDLRVASSTSTTRSTRGCPCSRWRWSTSTSSCSPPAPSTTRGSSDS